MLDERRRHILRTAEACFARDGFDRATIADVCREAGVSTRAVYVYFPNKEADGARREGAGHCPGQYLEFDPHEDETAAALEAVDAAL